ncbi:MAG: DUF481 domain-containing protein [Halieaceae bacterium]|nr:DUF481 domain-containing protein [Halieaceae bacterium]
MRFAILLIAFWTSIQTSFAAAVNSATNIPDSITLANGSVIHGTVSNIKNGKVHINTDFAGTLQIDSKKIVEMSTHNPVVVKLSNGTVLENVLIELVNQTPILQTVGTQSEAVVALTDIVAINPEPWQIGEGYKHEGGASLALVQQRGNSDTDQLDYKLEGKWTGDDDRFSVTAEGELDESDGMTNAENWLVTGKYDRFMGGTTYLGVNSSLKQDVFADLDMRFYLGPYFGRQYYDTNRFKLSAELGLTYVQENYISADDRSYPGANWTVNIGSDIFGADTELYLTHKGIWDLDSLEDIVLDTRIGLKIPLLMNIQAAAEYSLEYDSGAVAGVDEIDQSLKVRFGYRW